MMHYEMKPGKAMQEGITTFSIHEACSKNFDIFVKFSENLNIGVSCLYGIMESAWIMENASSWTSKNYMMFGPAVLEIACGLFHQNVLYTYILYYEEDFILLVVTCLILL